MKRISLLIFIFNMVSGAGAQCQLKFETLSLDTAASSCNHLFFKFTYSGGTPVSYSWTYGDGNACSCIKPKNVYNKNGMFQVCGKIKDANGCEDSMCLNVSVTCSNPCDLSEIGIHTYDTLSYSCDEYEFNTITSLNAKKIRWDFGDGDSSADKFTVHKYKKNGTYQVRLSIQDSIGCGDTADMTVVVNCPPEPEPCNFVITSVDTSTGTDCRTKVFALRSNKKPVTVQWEFGDGQTALTNGNMSSRTYADTGLYELCVYALDSANCKDTFCRWVRVRCPVKHVSVQEPVQHSASVYPNPVSDLLIIKLTHESVFVMYDMTMKPVRSGTLDAGKNDMDMRFFTAGTYLLKIENTSGVTYYRITREP